MPGIFGQNFCKNDWYITCNVAAFALSSRRQQQQQQQQRGIASSRTQQDSCGRQRSAVRNML